MIELTKPRLGDAIALLTDEPYGHYEGNDPSTISWDNPKNAPSIEAINSKLSELTTEWETKKYQRDRAVAFPSWQDQLDMQYWDKVNGTNKWQEAVAKVKADNPKPE
tara:strand:+ start:748 stop:1068 length:321 start_codon:yes stop_codon:yes gene_type:complete